MCWRSLTLDSSQLQLNIRSPHRLWHLATIRSFVAPEISLKFPRRRSLSLHHSRARANLMFASATRLSTLKLHLWATRATLHPPLLTLLLHQLRSPTVATTRHPHYLLLTAVASSESLTPRLLLYLTWATAALLASPTHGKHITIYVYHNSAMYTSIITPKPSLILHLYASLFS